MQEMNTNNYFKCDGMVFFFDDRDRATADVAHESVKRVQRTILKKKGKYAPVVAWRQKTLPTLYLGMDGVSDPLEER